MEKKINLIPTEMAVPPKAVKIVRILTKISTIGAISLVVIVISAILIFVYFKYDYNKTQASVESLKAQISDLERSEQRLVLAKDRLAKIASIQSHPSIEDDLASFQEIIPLVGNASGSALLEANIDPLKTQFSATSANSTSLAEFLGPISRLTQFKNMVLTSLGFGQTTGFISDILLTKENE